MGMLVPVCLGEPALIEPLEPVPVAGGVHEAPTSAGVEDFLEDCYAHPGLRVAAELSLHTVPLQEVVELLAKKAGFSVVVDASVAGMVPLLMVRGEPVGSVLHTLLAGHSPPLGILIVGKVLHVASRTTLIKRARQILLTAPIEHEHAEILVNWLSWTEGLKLRLEAMWQHCVRQHVGPRRVQYFFIDDESKTILLQGTPEQVCLFKRMIQALDRRTPQVQIEARVVIARADFMTKLGLSAQLLYGGGDLSQVSVGGAVPSTLPWLFKTVSTAAEQGLSLPLLFKGKTATMNALNLVLNAAEGTQLVQTLLAPHIITCSGKPAVLHEGLSVPIESFAEDAVEGHVRTLRSAQYRDVGVKIKLKPYVLPRGKEVRLDVIVENSHVMPSSTHASYPTIMTSRLHNTIVLEDGATVLLGGLTQKNATTDTQEVPWLARLPVIGRLFSGTAKSTYERRLYVFLHARLV